MSRPRHSAKNKSLPSATTMTLGKEIKELIYIYIYGCTMALGVGGREFFRPWIVRGVLDRTGYLFLYYLFFDFSK